MISRIFFALLILSPIITGCSAQEIGNIVSSLKKDVANVAGVTITGISGEIIDDKTRKPITSALVNIEGNSTSTDANGNYKFDLPVGSYKLTITKDGYERLSRTIDVKGKKVEDFILVSQQVQNTTPTNTTGATTPEAVYAFMKAQPPTLLLLINGNQPIKTVDIFLYRGGLGEVDPSPTKLLNKSDATWTSDDPSILSVSADGIVTAKSVGVTTVTVTYKGSSTNFTVIVK